MIAAGRLVGGYLDGADLHGYLLSKGIFQTIELPCRTGAVCGIDPLGRMSGGMTTLDGHLHGLVVSGETCIQIDFPDSTATYANSVSSRGDIADRYTDSSGKTPWIRRLSAGANLLNQSRIISSSDGSL